MKPKMEIAALALLTVGGTGCYSTWEIHPHGLVRLDGFRAGQTRTLREVGDSGEEIEFTSDSKLHFRGMDGDEEKAIFQSIKVRGETFLGVRSDDKALVAINLLGVRSVYVKNPSPAKTTALALGIMLGSVPVAALFGIMIAFATSDGGDGPGRPLRTAPGGLSLRAPLVIDRPGRASRWGGRRSRSPMGDEATQRRLFAHWANAASGECASIPAFLALARDLRLASAPSALVRRALVAAREEANHTELCAALASEYAPWPIATRTPDVPPNEDKDFESLLERLALESFWDGCVAEGAAAAVARRSARGAKDEATAQALSTIARDEQGHADLSHQIMAHCIHTGGRKVRNALFESLEQRRADEEAKMSLDASSDGEGDETHRLDEDFARSRGLPSSEVVRAGQAEAWEKSVSALARL